MESTKSESDTNFKQLHPSQLAEDEYSTNIENEIESSKSKTSLASKTNTRHQQQQGNSNNVSNSNHTSMSNYSMMSKPSNNNNFLTSMIETTTNTFNQDSQDTGYQTNSGICGSTNNNSAQSSSNPSMMIMDTTNNNNNHNNLTNSDITSNCLFGSAVVGANNTNTNKKKVVNNATPMNIEMHSENEKENDSRHYPSLDSSSLLETLANKQSDLNHLKNNLKSFIANSTKRPKNLDVKSVYCNKSLYSQPSTKSLKTKKNSISLNSLEKIIQVEPLNASETLKINFSANSHFKPIKSTKSLNDSTNSAHNNNNSNNRKQHNNQQLHRVNFIKHKSDGIIQKLNLESTSLTNGSGIHEPLVSSCDISMSTLNNSNSTNWRTGQSCLIESGLDLDDTEMLTKKKHELDSLYMDQSLLLNNIAPSKRYMEISLNVGFNKGYKNMVL